MESFKNTMCYHRRLKNTKCDVNHYRKSKGKSFDIAKCDIKTYRKTRRKDNFVDDRVLTLLDKRDDEVEATIHTRYNESFLIDLRKHNDQYSEIKMASGATVLVSETYGIEL